MGQPSGGGRGRGVGSVEEPTADNLLGDLTLFKSTWSTGVGIKKRQPRSCDPCPPSPRIILRGDTLSLSLREGGCAGCRLPWAPVWKHKVIYSPNRSPRPQSTPQTHPCRRHRGRRKPTPTEETGRRFFIADTGIWGPRYPECRPPGSLAPLIKTFRIQNPSKSIIGSKSVIRIPRGLVEFHYPFSQK